MIFNGRVIVPASNWLLKIMFRQSTISKAQEIKRMSLLEQKAYLATKTIHKIISPDIELLLKRSLSDQIVDMLRQQQAVGNVQTEARQEIEKLFTKGIQVDRLIFPQSRVDDGLSPKNQLFKFSPTYLVTGQIFNLILKQKSINALWIGHYGISKTISVMLFWHLSSIITEYNFKTYGLQKSKFKLKIESYPFKVPKLIYYNINQYQSFSAIRSIIVKQTKTQFDSFQQQRLILPLNQEDRNWQISLRQKYLQKQIYSLLFIDQIHSLMASWRSVQDSSSESILKKKRVQTFANLLIDIGATFYGVVLLSSVDVQKSIHSDFKFGSGRNHSRLDQKTVKYPELLSKTQSICQLVDVFIFQFGQHFKIPILQQNWYQYSKMTDSGQQSFKSKIRTNLIDYLLSQKNQYFLTYLAINQRFKRLQQKKMQQYSQYKGEEDFKKLEDEIINQMKELIKRSIQQLKEKVQRFISKLKEQKQKKFVIWELTYNAKTEVLLNKSQSKYKVDIAGIIQKKDILDRHLFQYQESSDSIYCLVSPKILLQILKDQSKSSFYFMMKFYRTHFLDKLTRSGLGGHFERLLIDILSSGNVSLNIPTEFAFSFPVIKQKQYTFESIPKNSKSEIRKFGTSEEYKKLKRTRQQVIKKQEDVKKKNIPGYQSQLNQLEPTLEMRTCRIFSKRRNNWRFLDSMKKSFEEQRRKDKLKSSEKTSEQINRQLLGQSFVYLPVLFDKKLAQKLEKSKIIKEILQRKSKPTKNQLINFHKKLRQLTQKEDQYSKCIDFMLVSFFHPVQNIKIYAFDTTISQVKFLEKITNFIEEFLCFDDRHQNTVLLNNRKYSIQLNYFVMSPPDIELKNIPKELNKRFYGFLEFQTVNQENSTIVKVINKENMKPLLLSKIGIISLAKFKMETVGSIDEQNIQLQMFKEVSKRALEESSVFELIEEAAKSVLCNQDET